MGKLCTIIHDGAAQVEWTRRYPCAPPGQHCLDGAHTERHGRLALTSAMSCTRPAGHAPPHVAHGALPGNEVRALAHWD